MPFFSIPEDLPDSHTDDDEFETIADGEYLARIEEVRLHVKKSGGQAIELKGRIVEPVANEDNARYRNWVFRKFLTVTAKTTRNTNYARKKLAQEMRPLGVSLKQLDKLDHLDEDVIAPPHYAKSTAICTDHPFQGIFRVRFENEEGRKFPNVTLLGRHEENKDDIPF